MKETCSQDKMDDEDEDDDDIDDHHHDDDDNGEDDCRSEDQASYRVCKKNHNRQPYSVCSGCKHITTYKCTRIT